MIEIKTSDGKIFSRDKVIVDIIHSMIAAPAPIVLNLAGEGPCCQAIGIYTLLDDLCSKFNYPKNQITIITANFLEQHAEYRIIKEHQNYELIATRRLFPNNVTKIFDNNFKYFGSFIGHSNRYRLQLASYLYANQRDKTIQSYHCNMREPYHREFIGLEDFMFANSTNEQITWAQNLIHDSPIVIDIPACQQTINMSQNLNITKVYPNFFVELVSLTFFSGNTFYVDEKLWRPIVMRTPFMVQGPSNLIKNFQSLGFKTFGEYWDEGYSEDHDGCHVPAMIENIKRLSQLSVSDIESMYADMKPILEHNYNRLSEIDNNTFIQAFQ